MREIEFRGKGLNTRKWVYGDLHTSPIRGRYSIHNVTVDGFDEADPKTAGRYTGIKDKNGVKIFEGDIILNKLHKKKYVVRFCQGDYLLDVSGDNCPCVMRQNGRLSGENNYYLKAVGNIHDNP